MAKHKSLSEKIFKMDPEYFECVYDILENEEVQKLAQFTHHKHSTRLEHSLAVSYFSYKITKYFELDYRSTARGGLLHDFFLYRRQDLPRAVQRNHAKDHPKIALTNALRYFDLNETEQDIIENHMFLATFTVPRSKESFVVTTIDKYCAILDLFGKKIDDKLVTRTMIAKFALQAYQNKYGAEI